MAIQSRQVRLAFRLRQLDSERLDDAFEEVADYRKNGFLEPNGIIARLYDELVPADDTCVFHIELVRLIEDAILFEAARRWHKTQ